MKTFILALTLIISTSLVLAQDKSDKGSQRAIYQCGIPMDIDSSDIKVKEDQIYFQFKTKEALTKSELKKFLWHKDDPKLYFTGYFVNTTDSTVNVKRQDGSFMMIQEAKNEDGVWQPIEYWVYSGCGNSYFNPLRLESNQCVKIPIRKYEGSFKTEFRLKLKNYDKTIYSETFKGSIDISQFEKERKSVHGILYGGPASYLEDN